jgi:methylglyoxal synthase|nr:MAG TPA: methylglyoxal synthase [Caudoviricetes sp.]
MKILNIALIAHDARKQELVDWVRFNGTTLYSHHLIATGTTAKLLSSIRVDFGDYDSVHCCYYNQYTAPLNVIPVLSGPLGGDQMIGAMIAQGQVDVLIFFCDNLIQQGHQTDISALTRLASLYNIAFATNRTTADMILTSSLFANEEYCPVKTDFSNYLNRKI